jgi:hypothetical protein
VGNFRKEPACRGDLWWGGEWVLKRQRAKG